MKTIVILSLLLVSVTVEAKKLPKRLPALKAKQEKIIKKFEAKNSVVIPKNRKNRQIASSEAVAVSDPMLAMKPQK